jgi:predicted TIM-barrel fold metal-dependent hydrolase
MEAAVMSMQAMRVIDADSHVTEPADLWTSRLPRKWRDSAPHVVRIGAVEQWRIGDGSAPSVGHFSTATWPEPFPSAPPTFADIDPACFDAHHRLARLDRYGIYGQVLYPNLLGFHTTSFMALDPGLALACVRAYNDFLTEFTSADPARLVPIAMVPFWDLEESVIELERARANGHRGIAFGGHLERIGLPPLWHDHWTRLLAAAQDLDLPVNLHVGFSEQTLTESEQRAKTGLGALSAAAADELRRIKALSLFFRNNMSTIADLVLGGVCDRFPRLKFVSVESGFGYIPFLLDSMDWQWQSTGASRTFPGRSLPSEAFRRQMYATFWFEQSSLDLLERFADNIMFETDFPHLMGLPKPGTADEREPLESLTRHLAVVPDGVRRKALHDNAAALYGIG